MDRSKSAAELGKRGEALAVEFLKKQHYRILATNYRVKSGEIDIVARDGGTLVFVEVKTRTSDFYAQPIESVGHFKQRKLRCLAERYLGQHDVPECDVRFDVVSIVERAGRPEIELIRNAF